MTDLLSRALNRVSGTLGGQGIQPHQYPQPSSLYASLVPSIAGPPGLGYPSSGMMSPFASLLAPPVAAGNPLQALMDKVNAPVPGRQPAQATQGQAFGASRPGGVDTGAPSSAGQIFGTHAYDDTGQLGQWADLINRSADRTGVPALAYAASILGESGGDPTKVNQYSGAVGLLQALPVVGRGGMYSTAELQDPNLQMQLAEPEFQTAYTRAVKEGWQGPQLLGATIAYAQRYERYADQTGKYDPSSDTNQYFLGKVNQLWNQGHTRTMDPAQLPSPDAVSTGVSQNDLGLDPQVAAAFCGPAAAIWFARTYGREPTAMEALDLGKQVGWTQNAGMAGPASEVALLNRMGISSSMEPVNWDRVRGAASAGQPVILNTSGHYYQVGGHDPQSGKLRLVDAVGRGRWFDPDAIGGLGFGTPDYAIYGQAAQ